jgi:8-oxo-dGTP pyrophosphatase MutT (NUDIX family)
VPLFSFQETQLATPLFDPVLAQLTAMAGETPLAAERLESAWLRTRLANPPPWLAEPTDEQRWIDSMPTRAMRKAAVLIAIIQRAAGPTLLFTQRTADLTDHPGQISFPGGRVEDSDASAIETALRESEEEIGLSRLYVEVIGQLPEYHTGTGYSVTPVVALVTPPFTLQADPREVAEIFEVPLAFLMNGLNHQCRRVELPEQAISRSFYAIEYKHYFIWGATAGMLRNLFHLLRS